MGGGMNHHLPVSSGYAGTGFRCAVDFPAVDWTGITELTTATLSLVTSAPVHLARGVEPGAELRRITAAWTPNGATGDSGGAWSGIGDVYPGPSTTEAGAVVIDGATTAETFESFDVTRLVLPWAPVGVLGPAGNGRGAGALQHGIALLERTGSIHNAEWYSARAPTVGSRPRLVLATKTTKPPGKPSLIAPVGVEADARTFRFTSTSTLPLTGWDVQVAANADMSGTMYWYAIASAVGISGAVVTAPYAGLALPAGPTLYWRARALSTHGYGLWSGAVAFTVDPTPTGRDAYGEWALPILGAMAHPRLSLIPGTIRPHGAHVAELVTSELGSRWRLDLPDQVPPVFADLQLAGMSVEVGADTGWEVQAVTGHVASQGRSGDYLARAVSLSPIAHWRLGDAWGSIRQPFIGTIEGTPSAAGAGTGAQTAWGPVRTDEPEGCLYLNGTGYVEFGDVLDFAGGQPFTVTGWFRFDADPAAGGRRLVSKEATGGGWFVSVATTVTIGRSDAAGTDTASGRANAVARYGWRHFAAVCYGTALAVYVNGLSGTFTAAPRVMPGNANPWTVGRISANPLATAYWNGFVDELSVFDRALTRDEVLYLYGGGD